MKHTPGPWVRGNHFIYGPVHVESRHTNGRILIAEVVRGSHRADPRLDGGADRFDFDSEADARLIAAAPDLLSALENAVLQIEYLHEKFSPTGSGEAVLAQARAAIAKAGGR